MLISVLALSACSGGNSDETAAAAGPAISGQVEGGLRVLTFDPTEQSQQFTIYRGDYVSARLASGESFTIQIADLEVDKQFPVPEGEKAYFKVPNAGSFAFKVGDGGGVIQAIDYSAAAYRELSSAEAAELIANIDPVIVDVRTPREYQGGHLENSQLIPVQVFQRQISELAAHKNDPVFVYCRTGNRSTVAAKILVDNGFTNVLNLRRGIVEWGRSGLPVVK